ncbi:murein hydrolase activator EnvC family protein [Alysiella filiformis]|uniref:Septal ring factor EnvC, activator of murein hydrolases AmiA and AmiB n=1 Tax=Alysiella filiformis DSM 16848 TaxID=1120981 RepID=A0A286E251_9NEIS|nr:peptidoglycan DD-metalloendopeptidase family protein [Alysiella filiformis]UBQ56165.1 peptidoglycan DD-metalloendopeptidase family protein [Alysiella filiformis DSM 16848]SOD64975.1 Septal ring factor EnvC, activator of murein hydrolases AmiA and AmiB [Alysiella filiformis DSM 16848]
MRTKFTVMALAMCLVGGVQAAPEIQFAAPNETASEQKTDTQLKDVKQELFAAQKSLNAKKAQHQRAKQVISQTQIALQQAKAELAQLHQQQKISWQKLQKLQQELSRLQTEVAGTKAQVARLLVNNYKNQQPSAIVLFLQNANAADKSRYLQYSKYINAANDKILQQLAEQQAQLQNQEQQIQAELQKLQKLMAAAKAKVLSLGKSHQLAVSDSLKLTAEIDKQNNQIAHLREDERRLNAILVQIAQQRAAKRKAEAAARAKAAKERALAAQQAAKSQTKNNPSAPAPARPPKGNLTAEDLAISGGEVQNARGFSRLQGTLRKPVSGSIAGRFGQARESGGTWRGIFIATTPASVQSIAAGEVAYVANLRGYGTTVVIDHGDGYMSVYSGLSGVSVGSGSQVAARQSIGTSGTLSAGEQGLYFEIRYRSRAINPLSWVR